MLNEHQQKRREEYIAGLREFADWLEAHPDFKMPWYGHTVNVFCDKVADFVEARRAAGLRDKTADPNYIMFAQKFSGGWKLDININKEKTCERVKVGEEIVPAKPARTVELPAEPEKVVEKYEWKCPESIIAAIEHTEMEGVPCS
jgi:hypothetical protein